MANTPATPRTWVATNTLTAAQLNVDVRDNSDYVLTSKPNCRVYNSAAVSVSSGGSGTAITFDSERYDKGSGSHSTSSNTSRLTVPTSCGGVYLIGANAILAASASGTYRYMFFRLNGTTNIAFQTYPFSASYNTHMNLTTAYTLAAGDYVEVFAQQDTGGAINITVQGNYSPEFWWIWQST